MSLANVSIHSALRAPGTEGVAPAVEREPLQAGSPDRPEMGFLDADHMP